MAARGPKYYNSADSGLFNKSELLYGLDQARYSADKTAYLAVVEGYTDVLMAHQMGIGQVVATMGTALNGKHVQQLRRFAPRVVLVFDADAGGDTGVDRALEVFASHDVDLSIATLPEGLDPCDLLQQQGADAFRGILEGAVDALEFKLNRVLGRETPASVEECRRAVDAVLGVIALAPSLPGQAGTIKTQLMVSRIARRLALKEETVWARLKELRANRRNGEANAPARAGEGAGPRAAKAPPEERQLLEVLLAEPALVPVAAPQVPPEDVSHPGLRKLLAGLYALQAAGEPPTLDQLRPRLDSVPLAVKALELQEVGLAMTDRSACLRQLLVFFQERRLRLAKQDLQNQLQAASDHQAALELLRQLQNQSRFTCP
jgi:DNA primase